MTEAKTAFRRMQQARHIGKIVLQIPKPLQPQDDRSYLITGGLGALGLHTAAYLAQLGAGDIVLTSRRTPDADAQRVIDDITERYRCRIHTFAADIGDESQVDRIAGSDPCGVATARGGGTPGGRARRRAASATECGTFPDGVGAQGIRCLPLGSVDEGRRSRLLHRLLVGVERARSSRAGQLRDRQCAARRAHCGSQGARLAGNGRQLRSLGAGRYGLVGGRAAPISVCKG